jgi:hypothetical protein
VGFADFLRRRWRRFLIPAFILVSAGAMLVITRNEVHPQLSRQTVIDTAVSPEYRHLYSRVAAKLVRRIDLERAAPDVGENDQPNQLIWVVAVSGDYGIPPSFACCSAPSDYHGKNTWGIAIIPDASKPMVGEMMTSWHGSWPPFFDSLPDLAAGD